MIPTFVTIFLCMVLSINAEPPESTVPLEPRIVGGEKVTDMKEFRYQASIRLSNEHLCGGTILDANHILTSASCCFDSKGKIHPSSLLTVVVGDTKLASTSKDAVKKDIKNVFTHSSYNAKTHENDIAILRTLGTFGPWSPIIGPLSLSKALPVPWTRCIISGWGKISGTNPKPSNDLYSAVVPVTDDATCKELRPKNTIKSGMFCAGYSQGVIDSCQGDEGGPLVCNHVLTGIISWGFDCGKGDKPGVFTDVSLYINWIDKEKARSSSGFFAASTITVLLTATFHVVFISLQ